MTDKIKNSIESLSEIQRETVNKVKEFIAENKSELEKHYFSVISESDYPKKIIANNSEIYEDIELDEYNKLLLSVSVVILTANYFECQILNTNMYKEENKGTDDIQKNKRIKRLKNGINLFKGADFRVFNAYILKINEYTVLHLSAPETGSHTPCGSSDLVRYVYNNVMINPKCIISFGICYGISTSEHELGHTLIANKIYPSSIALKADSERWVVKSDDYILNLREIDPVLYNKIDQIISGQRNSKKEIAFCNANTCNMLTGEAVINDETVKINLIQNSYGCKIEGGEMEGYGLVKECMFYCKLPCIIIKAICDWGSCKNIDDYLDEPIVDCKGQLQAYAAYCAFTVLRKFFYENLFNKESIKSIIQKEIMNKFYVHGYVQAKTLERFVNKCIKKELFNTNYEDKQLSLFIYKCVITDLINNRILTEIVDEGITGYAFV